MIHPFQQNETSEHAVLCTKCGHVASHQNHLSSVSYADPSESKAMRSMNTCTGRCTAVPQTVQRAVADAVHNLPYSADGPDFRNRVTEHVAAAMMRGGWRFCRCFRHEVTPAHAEIYDIVYTCGANNLADDLLEYSRKFPDLSVWDAETIAAASPWWSNFLQMCSRSHQTQDETGSAFAA